MILNIGDKVKVRSGLLVGNRYDNILFVESMENYEIVTIDRFIDTYLVKVRENRCTYSLKMFDYVTRKFEYKNRKVA